MSQAVFPDFRYTNVIDAACNKIQWLRFLEFGTDIEKHLRKREQRRES